MALTIIGSRLAYRASNLLGFSKLTKSKLAPMVEFCCKARRSCAINPADLIPTFALSLVFHVKVTGFNCLIKSSPYERVRMSVLSRPSDSEEIEFT